MLLHASYKLPTSSIQKDKYSAQHRQHMYRKLARNHITKIIILPNVF